MAFKDEETKKAYYEKRGDYIRERQRKYAEANREAERKRSTLWRRANKEQHAEGRRKSRLKLLYGITPEQYNELFAAQEGKCDLCGIHQQDLNHRMCVDHCHTSGKVRGLLCKKCNAGLGQFNDNPELLAKAAEYIKRKK